jgi:hypothetical protein
MGVEEVIRDAFTRARDYKRTWDEYRAAVKNDKNADSATQRSATRTARRNSRRQTLRSRALLRRSEILMLIISRTSLVSRSRLSSTCSRLQGRERDRRARRRRVDLRRLVGYKIEAYDAIPYNARS